MCSLLFGEPRLLYPTHRNMWKYIVAAEKYADNGQMINKKVIAIRVEMSTDFATRVPDTHYPTGTWVLVTNSESCLWLILLGCQPVLFSCIPYVESCRNT